VAHVGAGRRSFDRSMPEELNRVLVDRMSSLLFCATEVEVGNLAAEGITEGVHLVGDAMADWDGLAGSGPEAIVAAVREKAPAAAKIADLLCTMSR